MKLNSLLYFFILTFVGYSHSQFDQTIFFNRVNSIYHNLSDSDLKNFSVQITSDYFEYNAGKEIDHDVYSPIEFIWEKPRRLNFNRIKLPGGLDSTQQAKIYQLQNEMFQELRGIFLDWQRFMGGNLLFDLPEKYFVDSVGDTVHIVFDAYENNAPVKMKFYFGKNALCFRIETIYRKIKQKIITTPTFVLIDGKWLCTEWIINIVQNGVINSGFSVDFQSGKYKEYWLPIQALIKVQTRKKLNQTFTRLYKFRNLEVNKALNPSKN